MTMSVCVNAPLSSLVLLLVVVVLCNAWTSVNAQGQEDDCSLPPNIRPVVQINGFGSGLFFDSAENFDLAFPNLAQQVPGGDIFGSVPDLELQLIWNGTGTDLTQEPSPIGPEVAPDDVLPGLFGPANDAAKAEAQLFAIVAGWEAAVGGNTTLFYPVAWDWRRDFYEQSERVLNMVLFAKQETGCNPVVVGSSFGGLVAYTAFTRYGAAFADNVHGMLYAVCPLYPMSIATTGFVTGFLGAEETFPPEAVFSYPSVWELINPLSASCVNAPQEGSEEVQECMEGELDTGVSCESGGAACGRPADFPDPQFYLPIDLQDPTTYDEFIFGLTLRRALNGTPPVLSEEERAHIQSVTQLAARVHEGTVGARSAEVAALHPPTITLSLSLGNVSVPGLENQVIFEIPTALECVTPQGVTEGSSSAPPCEFLAPTRVGLSDGLLPSESTFLLNSAAFGDKLQPVDTFVDCGQYSEIVSFGPDEYPQIDEMLCSLVLRGNRALAEAMGGDAPGPDVIGGQDGARQRGYGTDSMEGYGYGM